ncbi:MAG: ABC transporter permease [Oscillospiraceae bacterium]|nr:ABC transporter permease [Oscillospiraceae bacterium]
MVSQLKELYAYRQMIISLVRKDLRGRYKGSVLGFLWTFINPLFQLIVYTIVFSYILKSGIDKYYLYLFVALIPWIFFSSSITGGASSIIAQKDLVKKIYFPRQVIPISYVTSCFVNMLLCFIVIFIVVLVSGIGMNFLAVLCLPVIMIVEYIMALGMALLSSAVTVYFKDLEHILGIVSMAWMYLTPIMYDKSIVPEQVQPIFNINPMTHVIECYRAVLYEKSIPQLSSLLSAFLLGVLFLVLGWVVFNRLQKHFAEEL